MKCTRRKSRMEIIAQMLEIANNFTGNSAIESPAVN